MKSKLKVMILHNIISPYRNPLFEELSKKYDLKVYFCKTKTKDRKWETSLKNYSFKHKILKYFDAGKFVFNPTLIYHLIKEEYDYYIYDDASECFLSFFPVLLISKIKKKPLIVWTGDTLAGKQYYKNQNPTKFKKIIFLIKRYIEKVYYSLMQKPPHNFISYSKGTDKFILKHLCPNKNKIFTGTQNYPESLLVKPTWKSKPKEFKNKKIIFYLGYLNKRKGVKYLIEAFNKLNRKDTLLLIAGTGEEENKLKELAKNNKNIKFLGYKNGVEKANYYSISDFFVFPTLYDVWGHVVTEALYYGSPVICTDKAEAKELIEEGKTGFIVKDKNVDELKDAMEKLLDNPNLLKQMKLNVGKISKSKIVDIKTSVKTFEKAIKYARRRK